MPIAVSEAWRDRPSPFGCFDRPSRLVEFRRLKILGAERLRFETKIEFEHVSIRQARFAAEGAVASQRLHAQWRELAGCAVVWPRIDEEGDAVYVEDWRKMAQRLLCRRANWHDMPCRRASMVSASMRHVPGDRGKGAVRTSCSLRAGGSTLRFRHIAHFSWVFSSWRRSNVSIIRWLGSTRW